MPDQLAALETEFREVADRARVLVERVGVAQAAQRPPVGGWSVAECLLHLDLTTRAFLPLWRDAYRSAPKGDGPYALDFWGKVLVWLLEPPSRMKIPTTPPFQPPAISPERVLPEFLDGQQQLLAALAAARGRQIDRVKIASPFNQRMHYSVYSSFRIGAAHQRRHLAQAERAAGLPRR